MRYTTDEFSLKSILCMLSFFPLLVTRAKAMDEVCDYPISGILFFRWATEITISLRGPYIILRPGKFLVAAVALSDIIAANSASKASTSCWSYSSTIFFYCSLIACLSIAPVSAGAAFCLSGSSSQPSYALSSSSFSSFSYFLFCFPFG